VTGLHPELRRARFIPRISVQHPLSRVLGRVVKPRVPPTPPELVVEDLTVPGLPGEPEVGLRIYRPRDAVGETPGLFWIHGGGYVGGTLEQDEGLNQQFALQLGITVVALRYRVAPAHPWPAALHDADAGLLWTFRHAAERGIDARRIAVGGDSAGGGLAAALVLHAHDQGEVRPVFQLLVYPMLDDRTVVRTDHDTRDARIWTAKSNRYGWASYLGVEPGGDGVSPYAAAARRENLRGLPPAWIGVGTLDVFHDEDVAYAERLEAAGVPCRLVVVPGAFHGFDRLRGTAVGREFWEDQLTALRGALLPGRSR
jgi:acetyl esterase/lipase